MIELFQILLFFSIFTFILIVPINLFQSQSFLKNFNVLEKSCFNLTINLNLLLVLSFLDYPVKLLQPILLSIFIIIFFYNYHKNLFFFKKFLKSIFPLFLIFFVLSVNISTELFLGWDAKFFYYVKSLFFFEEKTIYDLNKFSQNIWHPYFGSYLWGFFWSISPTEIEYFGRLFYLFLFCYSFFLISQFEIDDKINNLIFFILIILFYEYKFFSGLQEILIFSLLVLISKFFYKSTLSHDRINLIMILLLSNLFLWIKSEGIVYYLISILMIGLTKKFTYKEKFSFFLISIILYFLKVFIYDIANFNLNSQSTFYNLDYLVSLDFQTIIFKIKNIFLWLGYYTLANIFYPIFILIILSEKFFLKKRELNFEFDKLLYLYIVSIAVFIFLAYILRDMEIIKSIRTTMDRLVMTASGFLVYPCIMKVMHFLKYKKIYK